MDGNDDDIRGLINFVRGYDYFAYGGCEEINNVKSRFRRYLSFTIS